MYTDAVTVLGSRGRSTVDQSCSTSDTASMLLVQIVDIIGACAIKAALHSSLMLTLCTHSAVFHSAKRATKSLTYSPCTMAPCVVSGQATPTRGSHRAQAEAILPTMRRAVNDTATNIIKSGRIRPAPSSSLEARVGRISQLYSLDSLCHGH